MDIEIIRLALNNLLSEIEIAQKKGYEHANAPLTEEVLELIPKIKSGNIADYVTLQYTAGPFRCFSETLPSDCQSLESAWYKFIHVVQGRHDDPEIQKIVAQLDNVTSTPNKTIKAEKTSWLRQVANFFRLS